MPSAGFEPAIPTIEGPQAYASDSPAMAKEDCNLLALNYRS